MHLVLILGLAFGLLPLLVQPKPVFNKVNGYDLNGNQCSLPTYNAYLCPRLCVQTIESCPQALRPTCAAGETYCVDGTCRQNCPANLISSCQCPGAQNLVGNVYACTEQRINIKHFLASNKSAQSIDSCTNATGISSIPEWSPTSVPIMWGTCPLPDYGTLTYTEPVYIVIYTFYSSCVVLTALWVIYKSTKEKLGRKAASDQGRGFMPSNDADGVSKAKETERPSTEKQTVYSSSTVIEDEEQMNIKAYRRDWVGMIFFMVFVLQTTGHVACMIMMTCDYYAGHSLFRGNDSAQSKAFLGMWYFYFVWFTGITLFRHRLPNFYRIQCSYEKGQYVQVERKEPATIFLEDQSNSVVDLVRLLDKTAKRLFGLDVVVTIAPLQRTQTGQKYFVYQCTRYVYDTKQQDFQPYTFDLGETCAELAQRTHGLSSEEALRREELVGPNFIKVYVPNPIMALMREFSSFFYIYQFTVLWLFYYFYYWQVGIADLTVILVSAFVKVVVRVRAEKRIKSMAEFTDRIRVMRDGEWIEVSTAQLFPGDVFEVAEGKSMPCDCVILSGNIVADESSLTGEPLPVRKFPLRLQDTSKYDRTGAGKVSTLFAGTTISQAQSTRSDDIGPVALVTHTGTATDKGELVKKILFPAHVSFVFDEQIKVVILILLGCGLVSLGVAFWLYTTGTNAWFYSMFSISQLVSPLLPAALVVGQSVASGRLRDSKIYCVDLPRILMAGKVQFFCFDKTGTLTKEGLEFAGVHTVRGLDDTTYATERQAFDSPVDTVDTLPRLMHMGLATCHAVTVLNHQFIGNPVDIEMFRSSKWTLDDHTEHVDSFTPPMRTPDDVPAKVHILKRFEFVHARMSMSVAVLDTLTNKVHIFVKGAYEKIKDLSTAQSIPDNYDEVTAGLARKGCYVLGLSHREIHLDHIEGGMNGFLNWTRDDMERHIDFIGLIVFRNQLKPDTAENIEKLKHGATRTIMITGDTALTGVYIARQCGMCLPETPVLLGDYDAQLDRVVWHHVDDPEKTMEDDILENRLQMSPHDKGPAVELAVTGKAFDWLMEHALIRKYLLFIRVFARMTPSGKVECVKLHMERGITAMTGDGGNDCGALRAAHVGIAMSEAEASIVSPFSTSHRSVASCVELLRQGRAALATSLTGYKYLIMYGQVMFMLKIFTFYFSVSMNQNIWIAMDVLVTVLLTWAVSQAKAAPRLESQRPTARLLGPQTMASSTGLVAINWSFLIGAMGMLYQQGWFRCNEFDSSAVDLSKWWLLSDNYEGEVIAIVCIFQFINNAAVFNFGYKFRQSWWRNYALVFLWLLYLAIVSFWTLADPNGFSCLFRFNCGTREVLQQIGFPSFSTYVDPYNTPLGHNVMPRPFRWKLWGLCVGNILTALSWERLVVIGPVHEYLAKIFPVRRLFFFK